MGRRKASPTPRGELLGAFIASAHSSLPVRASSTRSKTSAHATGKASAGVVKSAKSSQPGAHVNQPGDSWTLSNKRRLPDIKVASKDTPGVFSSTVTLRSSKKNATPEGSGPSQSPPAESLPNKRQKVESEPRYASRSRKPLLDSDSSDVKVKSITHAPKLLRPTRAQRKTPTPVQQGQAKERTRRQKEAIALLQGPEANDDVSCALPTPPADSASDGGAAERYSNPHEVKLGAEIVANKVDEAIELRERQDSGPTDLFRIKPASPRLVDTKSRAHVAEVQGGIDNGSKNGGDSNSAISVESGYATDPPQNCPPALATPVPPTLHPTYLPTGKSSTSTMPTAPSPASPPASLPAYSWPYTSQTPWSVPDVGTHTFINSTRGQKVKGRPFSRIIRQANNSNRVRNVANTYPRKQPFKAQIMFDGYPPEDQPLREGATLWEICQEYPNHLTGKVLEGFVQKEWSANELCACLKDNARKVLTDRPGKDKTMVFQKRLERIKKDLIAKGEFDQLMNGPEIRPDGRPTWVKRGNVRRR